MKNNENKKTVFLTGAGGLLGSHITRELLLRNYSVVALIEIGKEPATLTGLTDVSFVYGDILNVEEIISASKYCDYIIHAAANTSVMPARSQKTNDINIKGTQNIIHASLQNKVKRLVYIGSASSFGYGSIKNPGNEASLFSLAKFGLDYIDSKHRAHQMVLSSVKNEKLPAIILCPTFMLGKYDSKPGSGAMIVSVHSGKLPGYSAGGRNYIYAADVAVAVVNAINRGQIGESYILGNQNLNYKNAFTLMAKSIGVKAPAIRLPKFVVLFYGILCSATSKVSKKNMPLNFPMARIANEGVYYNSSKAIKELGLPQTPITVAIKECYGWLKKEGLLNKK